MQYFFSKGLDKIGNKFKNNGIKKGLDTFIVNNHVRSKLLPVKGEWNRIK